MLRVRLSLAMKQLILVSLVLSIALLVSACASPDNPEPGSKAQPTLAEPEPPVAPAPPPEPPVVEPPPAPPAPIKNEPKKAAAPKEVTLSSGLKMIDSKTGEGEAVKPGNFIQVHYTGWLNENGVRGAKFDSSVDRGQPFEFTVGQGVIRGWSEGVVGMQPGGKRQLIIPPDLGYGARGAGGVIPPNAVLDFEIELLKILR